MQPSIAVKMPVTDRDLADSTPWKKIQQITFTHWTDEHLKCVNKRIVDLQWDLGDGLRLIALLEVLSQKKMYRKYHDRPNFRQMKLENVSVALEFLEKENIKLVSIDSKAIVDGNLKLILGLIWTLILHYSTSMPTWEGEDEEVITPDEIINPNVDEQSVITSLSQFPKAKLKHRAPLKPKLNPMKAHAYGPGIEPTGNRVMWPAVFTVETFSAGQGQVTVYLDHPDGTRQELKVEPNESKKMYGVTYIPQVAGAHKVTVTFAGQEIPKSPFKVNVALGDTSKVTVKGPRIEPVGNIANKPAYFDIYSAACLPQACRATGRGLQPTGLRVKQVGDIMVDTRTAGSGDLKVLVKGPKGAEEPVKQVSSRDGVLSYEYHPKAVGKHNVSITWGGQHIPKSPFEVTVGAEVGPQQIRVWGPGLHGGIVGKPASFVVESIGTDVGVLGFAIEGPSQAKIQCEDQNDGSCDVHYWPTLPGKYAVHVTWDEESIEHSPFMAHVIPDNCSSHPDKVKAFGPGLEKSGCLINQLAEFTVNAENGGKGPLKVTAQDADGLPVDVKVKSKGDGLYSCSYTPASSLKHTVAVAWAGVNVPNGPFRLSPSQRPLLCKVDPQPGKADVSMVRYIPTEEGVYSVNVSYDGHPVPGSPFSVEAHLPPDPCKVKAFGPSLVGSPAAFDTRGAATGSLELTVEGPSEARMECTDSRDRTCSVSYVPSEPADYLVRSPFRADVQMPFDSSKVETSGSGLKRAKVRESSVLNVDCSRAGPGSPFKVPVMDVAGATKVQVSGPGVGSKIRANIPQSFKVNCRNAGEAPLAVTVTGPRGLKIPADEGDGTYHVSYTPTVEGMSVEYADEVISNSHFTFRVLPTFDTSKVRASGPGLTSSMQASFPMEFTIDAKDAGQGQLSVLITQDGKVKEPSIHDNGDGTCQVSYLPDRTGRYTILIKYGGDDIPASPYRVRAMATGDASKCTVTGPGIGPTLAIGEELGLVVNAKGAGKGKVRCAVVQHDDNEVEAEVVENEDGTFDIFYTALAHGNYVIYLRFGGENIPGSAFKVMATSLCTTRPHPAPSSRW